MTPWFTALPFFHVLDFKKKKPITSLALKKTVAITSCAWKKTCLMTGRLLPSTGALNLSLAKAAPWPSPPFLRLLLSFATAQNGAINENITLKSSLVSRLCCFSCFPFSAILRGLKPKQILR